MQPTNKIAVDLDVEGPLVRNDNAFELTVALARLCGLGAAVGRKFFEAISNIDDLWGDFALVADIDRTYSAGHTLKVILPFLRAMVAVAGVGDSWLYGFSRRSLRVVPHTGEVLRFLNGAYKTGLISTSYDFFVRAFCDAVGFPFDRATCTVVGDFERVSVPIGHQKHLLALMKEVASMPLVEFDKEGCVYEDSRQYAERLKEIVWRGVYGTQVGHHFLTAVHPVGQAQKRDALERHLRNCDIPRERAVYVGDSQTDVKCVELLADQGLSVMVNGKGRVCDRSQLMYIGRDARAMRLAVSTFAQRGRQGTIAAFTPGQIVNGGLMAAVTPENLPFLKAVSEGYRISFRGVAIGGLS